MTASTKLLRLCLIAVVMVIVAACVAYGEPSVTVAWEWTDANQQGYVYVGQATGSYSTNFYVSTNTAQIFVPMSKTYYVAVTAVNAFGDQSDYSNEISIQRIKPTAPAITKYTITTK